MGKPLSSAHRFSLSAALTVSAAFLQVLAGLYPEAGMILSACSTIPAALIAAYSPVSGIFAYMAAAWMIYFFLPQEMPVFALTTGPLGWVLGWCRHHGKRRAEQLFWTTLFLFAGMILLTYFVGIPALGDLVWGSTAVVVASFLLFAFFTCNILQLAMELVWKRIDPGKAGKS